MDTSVSREDHDNLKVTYETLQSEHYVFFGLVTSGLRVRIVSPPGEGQTSYIGERTIPEVGEEQGRGAWNVHGSARKTKVRGGAVEPRSGDIEARP